MGLESEFVALPESEAEAICKSSTAAADHDGVALKNVSIVELAQLHALISGRTFQAVLPEFKTLASASDEGPWVYRLPVDFTKSLAGMTANDVSRAAARWLET